MPESYFSKINLAGHGFIERARILENETGASLFDTISKIESETMIDRQLLMLSKISPTISTTNVKDPRKILEYYYEVLSHIFLYTETKSPLKQAASRLLTKFPEEYFNDIAACLCQGLTNLMKKYDCESFKHTLNKISDCFENFPVGISAVSLCLCETLSFISSCLCLFHNKLSESLSPVQLMEIVLKCHSALRAAVAVLQKFLISIKEKAKCDNMTFDQTLKDMLHVSVKLVNHELVPMDSKGNCGMVIVILFVCLHDDGYNMVLDKLLSETSGFLTVDEPLESVYFKSEIAQMSICSGLVTVTPADVLFSVNSSQKKYFLEAVFMKLMSLSEGTESALSLGCSRALQQALHIIHDAVLKNSSDHCLVMLSNTQILSLCLDFVWSRMEHFMDCVRHAAKAMLHDLVQIGNVLKDRDISGASFLESIVAAVEKIPIYKKSKYIALAVLACEMGCQKLMTVFPCLVTMLLMVIEDPSMSAHVSNGYESLMLKNFEEEDMSIWINIWITPLFEAYPKSNVCYIMEGIIRKAMAVCPALLDYAVSLFEGDSIISSQLKVFIVCLKIGTKLGVIEKQYKKNAISEEGTKWMGIIKYDLIMQALMNKDDEVRMSALSLIVESNKTTRCLKPVEMELMKCFLVYNINSDVASLRQKNLMLVKKFLVRVKESSFPLLKSVNQGRSKVAVENGTLVGYRNFLRWFESFCFRCFIPGANHSRRASALEMLTMLDEILSSVDKTAPLNDKNSLYSRNWLEKHADSLLLCLRDSFESNKILALNLLIKFPAETLGFTDPLKFDKLLTTSLKLASSVKPPDCITGAYLLKLMVCYPETEAKLVLVASEITSTTLEDFPSFSEDANFYEKSIFCMIWILVAQLERELAVAKVNVLLAAGSGPLYGTLFCIRNLLKNLDFKCIADNFFWKKLILKLIPLCFEMNSAVIHIVNSSSPEGHLPMDFAPAVVQESVQSSTVKDPMEDASSDKIPPVTAQMVLLCSWRTVKEVSLFLGDLTNQASILCGSSSPGVETCLLTEDIVVNIGDYFTKLLSETKHRGAFEQAYVGFCLICKKLWKQPSGNLSQLPRLWLRDITNEITRGKESSKLCATRRSAGVPFIVQALVTTELDVSQPSCLKEAMESLLNLLEKGSMDDLVDDMRTESHTHAMNILRALFRHSLLGELVTPYISRGVMAAINGFKGDTWASRNSATLLFGALIIRVFGVKHSRDDVNRRNRMTGRVFFERFPSLYDFLLGELKEAATVSSKTSDPSGSLSLHLFPSLFPVLIVLSRLYPSSLEGTDSNMQLSAFIPFVECCLRSKVYKIRELAARAMVPLITSNIHISHLEGAFSKAVDEEVEQNKVHGILLQISFLLQEVPYPQQENEEMLCERTESWINMTKKILVNGEAFSYMVKEAYMRVLRQLLLISSGSVSSNFPTKLWNNLFELIKSEIRMHCASYKFKADNSYLGCIFNGRATQILLEIAVIAEHTSQMLVDLLCSFLIEPFPIECVSVALSFISHIFGEEGCECLEEEDGLPQFAWPTKDHWQKIIFGHREYFTNAEQLAMSAVTVLYAMPPSYVLHRALKVIGYLSPSAVRVTWRKGISSEEELSSENNPFLYLTSICNTQPENVGRAALFCLTSLLHEAIKSDHQKFLSQDIWSEYCNLLMEFSSVERSESSRMTVAESLVTNSFLLSDENAFITTWDRCHLWVILLDLMEDHNPTIRDSAARISYCFAFMEDELKSDSFSIKTSETVSGEGGGAEDKWMEPDVPISFNLVDVMPQRLEEVLLRYMEKLFGSLHRYECAVTLLSLALRDSTSEESEYDVNEERVFDKGEANLFAEPLNQTRKCVKLLKTMFAEPLLLDLGFPIPSSVLALTGLDNCVVVSVVDFLRHSLKRLLWKLEVCGKNCGGQFDAFLTQGFDSLEQDVFKVGLVLHNLREFSKEISDLYEELCKYLESAGILTSFKTFCE